MELRLFFALIHLNANESESLKNGLTGFACASKNIAHIGGAHMVFRGPRALRATGIAFGAQESENFVNRHHVRIIADERNKSTREINYAQ